MVQNPNEKSPTRIGQYIDWMNVNYAENNKLIGDKK
jgi:hypothetical protein